MARALVPYVNMRFYYNQDHWGVARTPSPLCEVIEIRDGEIVRYKPVDPDQTWVGEVHVNFFHRVVKMLPTT